MKETINLKEQLNLSPEASLEIIEAKAGQGSVDIKNGHLIEYISNDQKYKGKDAIKLKLLLNGSELEIKIDVTIA